MVANTTHSSPRYPPPWVACLSPPPLPPHRASAVEWNSLAQSSLVYASAAITESVHYGEGGVPFGPSCAQCDGRCPPDAGEAKKSPSSDGLVRSSVAGRLVSEQSMVPSCPPLLNPHSPIPSTPLLCPSRRPCPPGHGTRQTGRSSRASGPFSPGVRDRDLFAPWILDRGQGAHRMDRQTDAGWLAGREMGSQPVVAAGEVVSCWLTRPGHSCWP